MRMLLLFLYCLIPKIIDTQNLFLPHRPITYRPHIIRVSAGEGRATARVRAERAPIAWTIAPSPNSLGLGTPKSK